MTLPDYRPTVFLPKTDFPMKASLPEREPKILARWQSEGLYARLRAARAGRPKFILHDGPPYANGDMHIGHALNHILKDTVCRTQTLLGKDAPYVPGWDCHGLPIEWKVEEQYRAKKRNKDEVPPAEFRAECRAYAQGWVDRQAGQLQRLGINGDWDKPYLTMDFAAEATIVSELLKVAESGQLYRGAKPVMWSPVEKTALAEAEVEYEDITSTQIDVAFEITHAPNAPELVGAYAVIWTTTPWTIPVNQALAYGPEVEYVLLKRSTVAFGFEGSDQLNLDQTAISIVEEGRNSDTSAYFAAMDAKLAIGLAATGLDALPESVLVASSLIDALNARLAHRVSSYDWSRDGLGRVEVDYIEGVGSFRLKGSDLASALSRHPMHHLGGFFAAPRPLLPGDFVTTEQGTGLVHMAPDHGEDDFELCKAHGIGPVFAVEGDGRYRADWAWLGGQGSVINPKFNAPDGPICTALREAGGLLSASADYRHSYPHSWRSKAKLIFRATPQWFVPMDRPLLPLDGEETHTLRETAIAAIAATRFVPEKGRNRIGAMVEGRPDWVLSRQRAWGVPITLFVDRRTGEFLKDPEINARIVAAVREQGVDAWTPELARELLGDKADDYEQITDILDVWFDSGCTHVFVLESGRWPELRWPADLYLEGSDQHRGWFQSSLLQSCATRGRAPYDAILTHGFTMDQAGKKMSKSIGNTIDPLVVMKDYGADIIRLWALSVDFTEDHRIGKEILTGVADQYRKLRNTFRYLLGALDGFTDAERVAPAEMPELERWVLHRLAEIDGELRRAAADFDFNAWVGTLAAFCNHDLSAFVFDVRKDVLYCEAPSSPARRAYRSLLDILFDALARWLAPVLVFTAEEAWGHRYPDAGSVHLSDWPAIDAGWLRQDLGSKWARVRELRSAVTEAIEPLRRAKEIGSSLEADVQLEVQYGDEALVGDLNFTELCIAAKVTVVATGKADSIESPRSIRGPVIPHVMPTELPKCARCWRHLPDVAATTGLCGRCDSVVNG